MQAQRLAHYHTLALPQFWAAHLYQVRREGQAAQAHAEIVISLTQKPGAVAGLAHGRILQGWGLVEEGQRESGITRILEGLTESRALGIRGGRTHVSLLCSLKHMRRQDRQRKILPR